MGGPWPPEWAVYACENNDNSGWSPTRYLVVQGISHHKPAAFYRTLIFSTKVSLFLSTSRKQQVSVIPLVETVTTHGWMFINWVTFLSAWSQYKQHDWSHMATDKHTQLEHHLGNGLSLQKLSMLCPSLVMIRFFNDMYSTKCLVEVQIIE